MTNSVPEDVLAIGERRPSRRDAGLDATRAELLDLLFQRHYSALLRLAIVMLGNREAAEDSVQDAFVALYRHQRTLNDPEAAESYLRSAVINRCRSWVRRQVTARAARPLMLVREHQESAEDTAVDHDAVGSVLAVMRTLPRRQREVLACRYVLQLSVAETAELLEISDGSVKAHTSRGLQTLQQRIEVAR